MSAIVPLEPISTPHIVLILISEDKELVNKKRQELDGLKNSYNSGTKERRYLDNLINIIEGTVAQILELKNSSKEKVEDFYSINEEAALVIGTFLAAVSQSGNIPNMAIISGVIAGGIKIGFKIAKWRYKNARRSDLQKGITSALERATTDATQVYNDVYQPAQVMTVNPEILKMLSVTARTLSSTAI